MTLEIHFSRKFSFLMVLAGAIILPVCIYLVRLQSLPLPGRLLAGVIGFGMLFALRNGIRMLARPPVMFRVDLDGVTDFYRPDRNDYKGAGKLIPWASIASLELRKIQREPGRHSWVIVLSPNTPGTPEQYVDATSGEIAREELLERMKMTHAAAQRRTR